jgi:hypothetical protein
VRTVRWKSKHRLRPRADRPVGAEPKNPKVTGSVKWIIASSGTVRGARPDRPRLPLFDIWRRIKWYIAVGIAVTADRCDFSRWCAGADRPDQGRGPSAVGRKGATTRKWLGAINTTPTTSIHFNQALQSLTFNTRASNLFQDTIKASNLSKFHNWDKWSLVISDLRERESDPCVIYRSCRLAFAIVLSSFPILILKWLVIKARDTKCVVVLAGSKWPGCLRRKLTRSKWSFERGKGLKETRSLWPPQRGLGSLEPNLGKTNHRVHPLYFLVDLFSLSFGLI